MIVLDGVYTFDDDTTRFHSVKAPTPAGMQTLLDRIIRRTIAQLERDDILIEHTEQPYLDLTQADLQDTFNAASVRYRIAIGPNSGRKTLTLRSASLIRTDSQLKPLTVNRDGFSLNATVSCRPHQRDRQERLCRYTLFQGVHYSTASRT